MLLARRVPSAFAALSLTLPLAAQCANVVLPGSVLPGANSGVLASVLWDPDGAGPAIARLVVAGYFSAIGGVAAYRIAAWDEGLSVWTPLGPGFNDSVAALTAHPNGDLIAAGRFTHSGSAPMNFVARWNGTAWSTMGGGTNNVIACLATMPNGDVVAAGHFTHAGGVAANQVARWDGSAWSPFGSGIWGVRCLLAMPNGEVIAGGYFHLANLGIANKVARWNGTSWTPVGTGFGTDPSTHVSSLALMPNGDIVAGGHFDLAAGSRISRWNGAAWSPLGSGVDNSVLAMTVHGNGDLIVGGSFALAGGQPAACLARWDGAAWSPIGSGFGAGNQVLSLSTLPDGDLVVGGAFSQALGVASWNLARVTTTCPALASSYGAGCSSSAGPVSLAAASLPWLGGTYRATTTGMPVSSIALDVFGLTQVSIAMPTILPQGVAGCSLLASPDLLGVLVPAAGSAQTQLGIPNTAALVNQVLYHQVAALELSAAGITAVTSSNGLTLTLGSF